MSSVSSSPDDTSDPPGTVQASDSANVSLHEVSLRGLIPGTRYQYEVTGPGLAPTGGTFTAAPTGAVPFRFVIYGDTRSDPIMHAATVRAVRNEGAEFVLHTGDLIEDGRREEQWQQFFEIEQDLLRNAPLVPVIGNHEIVRPGSVGVDNFRRYVHCEPDSPEPELDYALAYGNVRFVVANAYDDWTSPVMRQWLETRLERARREVPDGFVIVAMHWGPCSSGPHGENRIVRAAGVDEVLRQHRVDLVVSGHDHLYERGEDRGLRYIVSGGGGAPLYERRRSQAYTHVYASEYHYVRADVERDRIVFTAVRPDGSVIDRCTLRRTGWDCPPLERSSAPGSTVETTSGTPSSPPLRVQTSRACGCRTTATFGGAGYAAPALVTAVWALGARAARRRGRRVRLH